MRVRSDSEGQTKPHLIKIMDGSSTTIQPIAAEGGRSRQAITAAFAKLGTPVHLVATCSTSRKPCRLFAVPATTLASRKKSGRNGSRLCGQKFIPPMVETRDVEVQRKTLTLCDWVGLQHALSMTCV